MVFLLLAFSFFAKRAVANIVSLSLDLGVDASCGGSSTSVVAIGSAAVSAVVVFSVLTSCSVASGGVDASNRPDERRSSERLFDAQKFSLCSGDIYVRRNWTRRD